MKTTIDLPEALAQDARQFARDHGITLRELMVDGLRAELQRRAAPTDRMDFAFPTFGGDGLQPGVEWADVIEMSQREIKL